MLAHEEKQQSKRKRLKGGKFELLTKKKKKSYLVPNRSLSMCTEFYSLLKSVSNFPRTFNNVLIGGS